MRVSIAAILIMMCTVFTVRAEVDLVMPGYADVLYSGSYHQETKTQTQNSLQNQNFERMSGNSNTIINTVKVRPGPDIKHKIMHSKCGAIAKVKLQKDNRVGGGDSFGGIRL